MTTQTKFSGKAEEISSMGLAVPQITRVANSLRAKGIDIGEDIFTVKSARDAILSYLQKKEVESNA